MPVWAVRREVLATGAKVSKEPAVSWVWTLRAAKVSAEQPVRLVLRVKGEVDALKGKEQEREMEWGEQAKATSG